MNLKRITSLFISLLLLVAIQVDNHEILNKQNIYAEETSSVLNTENNLNYQINDDNTITILGFSSDVNKFDIQSIEIPSTIDGYPVTTIGKSAFQCCFSLENITLPNTLTTIEPLAFGSCTSLNNVIIPDSVIYLGYSIFDHCTSLTEITIPNGVTSLETLTFSACENLSKVIIPKEVTTIKLNAFYGCDNLTIYGYNNSAIHTYAIENNINFIPLDDDLNNNYLDLLNLKKYVLNISKSSQTLDINQDGLTNVIDLILLKNSLFSQD